MQRLTLAALAALSALALGACGNSTSSPPAPSSTTATATATAPAGEHNDADVRFAQMMIPHHQQAIEMAQLAPTRAASPQVKALAAQIEAAQQPEIDQMKGWLSAWGQPTDVGMSGMNHGGMSDGMMSEADMAKLQASSGKAFDQQFLQMMIVHHQGAITMAKTEQVNGHYPPAKTMAATIIRTQSDEIAKMNQLLKST